MFMKCTNPSLRAFVTIADVDVRAGKEAEANLAP